MRITRTAFVKVIASQPEVEGDYLEVVQKAWNFFFTEFDCGAAERPSIVYNSKEDYKYSPSTNKIFLNIWPASKWFSHERITRCSFRQFLFYATFHELRHWWQDRVANWSGNAYYDEDGNCCYRFKGEVVYHNLTGTGPTHTTQPDEIDANYWAIKLYLKYHKQHK